MKRLLFLHVVLDMCTTICFSLIHFFLNGAGHGSFVSFALLNGFGNCIFLLSPISRILDIPDFNFFLFVFSPLPQLLLNSLLALLFGNKNFKLIKCIIIVIHILGASISLLIMKSGHLATPLMHILAFGISLMVLVIYWFLLFRIPPPSTDAETENDTAAGQDRKDTDAPIDAENGKEK